jgi:hypothetical protein
VFVLSSTLLLTARHAMESLSLDKYGNQKEYNTEHGNLCFHSSKDTGILLQYFRNSDQFLCFSVQA